LYLWLALWVSAAAAESRTSEEPGNYTVQLGSFGRANTAQRFVEQITDLGYQAYYYRAIVNERTCYRVRSGRFETWKDAETYRRQIEEAEGLKGYVTAVEKTAVPPDGVEKVGPEKDPVGAAPEDRTAAAAARKGPGKTEEKPQVVSTYPSSWFLRGGDVVVFYGDSITEQKRYCQLVEAGYRAAAHKYNLEPTVKFHVMGYLGKTAEWGLQNLAEVLVLKPSVVTLMWGMHDANIQTSLDEESLSRYRQAMTYQVLACKKAGIRPVILTIAPVDDRPERTYDKRILEAYVQAQREVALENGASLVDTRKALVTEAARVAELTEGGGSGYFMNDEGQLNLVGHGLIAEAILDAWNIPRYNQRSGPAPTGARTQTSDASSDK
jgi:lysophospholipase L1-like esterase